MSALTLLAAIAGIVLQAQPSSQAAGPKIPSSPRGEARLIDRELYWARRRGLQFGVSYRAYPTAIEEKAARAPKHPIEAFGVLIGPSTAFTWKFIGPQPMLNNMPNFGGPFTGPNLTNSTGRISSIAINPRSPDQIVVGAAGGGVWLSTDRGSNFVPIFDRQATQAVGSVAIDAVNTDPPTIYVGTGEGNGGDSYYGEGIFKSSDLGVTWSKLGGDNFDRYSIASLAIDTSHNPPHLFAGVTNAASLNRADASFVVGDSSRNGLWRSTDGGNTWIQYPADTFNSISGQSCGSCAVLDVVVDPNHPNLVFAGVQYSSVFRSTDGGDSWDKGAIFKGIAPDIGTQGRQSIAIAPNPSSHIVYAMIGARGYDNQDQYLGFFRSTDSGANWARASVPSITLKDPDNEVTIDGTNSKNFTQSSYDQALAIDPSDRSGRHVVFGGVGIYDSTDGGAHWRFLAAKGGTHSDQHAIIAASRNDHAGFLVGNDGGLYFYDIHDATFLPLNETLAIGQIQSVGPHPTNNDEIIAGFQDNGTQLYRANNAWNTVETGDGGFALFDQVNPQYLYHTYATTKDGPQIAVSSDGGQNWLWKDQTQTLGAAVGCDGTNFYPPLAVDPAAPNRILFGAHHIYVSTDGMSNWQLQETTDLTGCTERKDAYCSLQDLEIASSDSSRAYALSQEGTTDNGSIIPFKVFNTTQANLDRNATWNDVTANLEKAFPPGKTAASTQVTSIAIDPTDPKIAFVTLSGFTRSTCVGHIYKTTDFGASWSSADGATIKVIHGANGIDPCTTTGSSSLPDVPALKILIDRTGPSCRGMLVGTDIGVFRSTDDGNSWSDFNLGVIPTVPIFDMAENENSAIVVGTHGRGAYQLVPPSGAKIAVASAVNGNGAPGQAVDAGTIAFNNSTQCSELIRQVTISFGTPGLFSAARLSASAGSATVVSTLIRPTSSAVFTFVPPLEVTAARSATLNLKVTPAPHAANALANSARSSTQMVTGVGAVGVGTFTGLPATLGTITAD